MKKDNRKDFNVDMSDEDFLLISKEAHKRDITFNKMFELMILHFIKEYTKNPKEVQNFIKNFNNDKKSKACKKDLNYGYNKTNSKSKKING